MKEITKNRWKKFGYFCLSLLPLLAYLAITIVVSAAAMIVMMVFAVARGEQDLMGYLMGYLMHYGVLYAGVGIIAFFLWYYFGCKRKQIRIPKEVRSLKNIILIFITSFGAQFVVSYLITFIQYIWPQAVEQYNAMMEMAGVQEVSVVMVCYVVLLGPIAEEVVFRGVTLFYAQKFTSKFWLANILQAVLFGIMHLNIIQGLYAFIVGLILGWVYRRFQSLYASIWMHITFNLLGSGLMDAINQKVSTTLWVELLWHAFGVVMFVVGIYFLRKREEA